MHYLKCEKCGHYNSVNSEYLVYCGKCKMHLTNNYIDWAGVHPDENFEDFKKAVCVEEKDISKQIIAEPKSQIKQSVLEAVGPVKKKQRLTRSQWIGISVGALFAAVFYQIGKYATTNLFKNGQLSGIGSTKFPPADTTNWEAFYCDAADFTILFPEQPVEETQLMDTEIGKVKFTIYTFEPKLGKDANIVYGAGYSDYPEGTIDSEELSEDELDLVFQGSVNGAVSNVQGKLLSASVIDYKGFPGREINIDFKDGLGIIKMRNYLVNNRMYILQVITPTENNFNNSINYFLDSFQIRNTNSDKSKQKHTKV